MQGKLYNVRVKLKRLGWLFHKVRYPVIVLVALLIGLTGWQIHKNQVNNTWKRATDYYTKADYTNAAKQLKNVPVPADPTRLAMYAQTMLATRQLPKAETAYTKLYSQKKDPFAKLVLGNVYNEEKKYDKAVQVYQQLIASNPNYTQAYVNLATVYKLQQNTKAAIQTAQNGVKANPHDVVLNELLVSMNLDDTSSAAYKTAVANLKELNPNDPLLAALNQ